MLSLPRNPLVRLFQFAFLGFAVSHPAWAESPPPLRTRAEVQAALPQWARSNRFPPFPELRDEESPAWLVRSRVVKREPWAQHPGFDLLSLVVTHSYCGPNLQGRIWELPYGRMATTPRDLPASLRPLRVGDEVICSLTSVWTSGAYSYHGSRGPLTKPVLGLKYNS